MENITFYFKADKKLELSKDYTTGETFDMFIEVSIETSTDILDKYEEVGVDVKRKFAVQMKVDPKLLYMISKEEYEENTKEN